MRHHAALVTGASRGIGLAIATRLARDGFDLTISARSSERLLAAGEALRTHGTKVHCVVADQSVEQDVLHLADSHRRRFGHLDVLVLSAGVGSAGPLESYPMHRYDRQFAVNVRGPFLLVQNLLPELRISAGERPGGAKVIAIASMTGVASEPDLAAYGASKAALISLCESLTVSEGEAGVSGTAISPGYVDTDMAAWMHERIDPSTMIKASDLAEIVSSLTRLSRWATVPHIAVTRPGPTLWRA